MENGEYIEYYDNGNIRSICDIKDYKMNGICIIYHNDNRVYSVSYYKDNKLIARKQVSKFII